MFRWSFIIIMVMTYLAGTSCYSLHFCPSESKDKTRIYIAGFHAFGERLDGSGKIPPAELAIDHVNNDTDILREYQLCIVWRNSECLSSGGIWAFYEFLLEAPDRHYVAILGPPCSTSTSPVAETSYLANLNTMSYWASSPSLSDRKRYPYFFRTFVSEVLLNPPKIALLDKFNWTKVATLTQKEDIFITAHEDLLTRLNDSLEVIPPLQAIFDKELTDRHLQIIKDLDLRIFLLLAYEDSARNVFCQVYKEDLYGRNYAWLVVGWFSEKWWIKEEKLDGCNDEQIETAVAESMYITTEANVDTESIEHEVISGMNASDFEYLMKKKEDELKGIGKVPYNFTHAGGEGFAYDAVWVIALSLNRAAQKYPIENFTYDDVAVGAEIFRNMNSTNFNGVTGVVSFSDGDREGSSSVEQLQAMPCETGWHSLQKTGLYCYNFVNIARNWEESREHCRNKKSFLASILSEHEYEFLRDQQELTASKDWFIGLTFDKSIGSLSWVDTTVIKKILWTPESFNEDKEKGPCYTFNPENGEWKAEDCMTKNPFICKRRPEFKEKIIYSYDDTRKLTKLNDREFIWHGDKPPPDRVEKEKALTPTQFIFLGTFACLGIVMALLFLVFNIRFRKHTFVKLSSHRLNNLIIAGALLVYLSICILGLEVRFYDVSERTDIGVQRYFCMLHIWLILTGFVLGFGALFSKTWRVYKVANIKGVKSVKIQDSELFAQVGVFLLILVIILIVWTAVDPMTHEKVYTTEREDEYVRTCTCGHLGIWAGIVVLYIGIILIFGVFLAWHTRNVTIPALNDSKLIGVCIYNITILFAVTIGVCTTIENDPPFRYMLTSSIMNFCASFTLLTIFIPKLIFVYKYPNADRKDCTKGAPPLSHISNAQHADGKTANDNGHTMGARSLWGRLTNQLVNLAGFNPAGTSSQVETDSSSGDQNPSLRKRTSDQDTKSNTII